MASLEVSATVPLAAPADQVWELCCDTGRFAEWVEGTDEVTRTDGPAKPGSTYDEVNPILGPWKAKTRWTVTEFEPPRRQVHRGEGLPLTGEFHVTTEVTPIGEDACEFTIRLHGTSSGGPIGALFARAMAGQVERDNRRSAENFARLAARELSAPGATAPA